MSVLNERAIIDIIISNLGLTGNNKRRDDDVSIVSLAKHETHEESHRKM